MSRQRRKKVQVVRLNISGEINEDTLRRTDANNRSLIEILQDGDGPNTVFDVYLSSPGGDVDTGITIYEMLRSTEGAVSITGVGIVGSIATLIFMAGDHRWLSPGTRVFVHPGSYMPAAPESILTIKKKSDEMVFLHEWYIRQLAERSRPGDQAALKKMRELCNVDSFLSATEAVALNIATGLSLYRE